MRQLIIILIFSIILMNPIFVFANNQNAITVKQLEEIIDNRFKEYDIGGIVDNKLKEKENNIISAYEKMANSLNWVLGGIGFFLAALVIFTILNSRHWIDQFKDHLEQAKEYKTQIQKNLDKSEEDKKQTEKYKIEAKKHTDEIKTLVKKISHLLERLKISIKFWEKKVYVQKTN